MTNCWWDVKYKGIKMEASLAHRPVLHLSEAAGRQSSLVTDEYPDTVGVELLVKNILTAHQASAAKEKPPLKMTRRLMQGLHSFTVSPLSEHRQSRNSLFPPASNTRERQYI